ncbi:hypothetical protein K443DRAFT_319797 [Laccaria amethystina LaAM-08-1]|uniref:Uncharacterized protein n=1 Tax=Laccaria amethystina LaAM-08-1 TaxID=1095629 RepID=A0A0C9XDA4_9AGAR|nr:hypothetical protein K443DRAFT_319797 [Laccaria amethystina LaAM-08-1]
MHIHPPSPPSASLVSAQSPYRVLAHGYMGMTHANGRAFTESSIPVQLPAFLCLRPRSFKNKVEDEEVVTLIGVWQMACTTGERGRQTAVGGTNHQSNIAQWQGLVERHDCDPIPLGGVGANGDQISPLAMLLDQERPITSHVCAKAASLRMQDSWNG